MTALEDNKLKDTQLLTKQGALAILKNEIKLNAAYINGEWQEISRHEFDDNNDIKDTDDAIDNADEHMLYDPSTAEVIAKTRMSRVEQVDAAAKAASEALITWSQSTYSERSTYLDAIANAFVSNFDKLVSLSVLNSGKPIEEAKIDVSDAIACYQYYANLIKQQPVNEEVATREDDFKLVKTFEPIGVCSLIVPWNFPMVTTAWKLAPALAAGCTVLLKPSEVTLLPELMLGNFLADINLPAGVVNIVPGGATVGAAMTSHHLVDKVSFTGSNVVGEKVMQQAAADIKDISLELGGKSAIIVCKDADIEHACELIIGGIFYNAGQVCSATSRLLVHQDIASKLYETLKTKTEQLGIGNGFETSTNMGPVVSEQQFSQVKTFLEVANQEGLTALTGGQYGKQTGYYIEPTIYVDVPTDSRLWREEVFGPVLVTKTFKSDNEAVALANDSKYALAATIVSRDEDNALHLATRVRAGYVWVNEFQVVLPEAGWGGFKQSGIGRELGKEGLSAFQKSKHILMPAENA